MKSLNVQPTPREIRPKGSQYVGCSATFLSTQFAPMVAGTGAANLRTKILDFRGFDSSRTFDFEGWNSHARRKFTGKLNLRILAGRVLSRETGRVP